MKAKFALLILPLFIFFSACKSMSAGNSNSAPPCPPGTIAKGAPPPKGSETWCEKTVDGKPIKEGPFVVWRSSGMKMIQGSYLDGKQNGDWTMWYDNGVKKSVSHYENGVEQGKHTSWYKNGRIDAMGQYKDGEKNGKWKRWDPSGFRNWTETYKDGNRIS